MGRIVSLSGFAALRRHPGNDPGRDVTILTRNTVSNTWEDGDGEKEPAF